MNSPMPAVPADSILSYKEESWKETNPSPSEKSNSLSHISPLISPSSTPGAFKPVALSEFLAGPPPPLAWVWEPYLPVGSLSLLTAYMKVGKSTFAYPLALAVMRGTPFLGTPTTQGPVLILAVEEHARDARLRMERFGATRADPCHIHSGRLDPASFAVIRTFVKEHGVRLVLLDTLSSYWQIHDENDNAEIIRRVSPFVYLAHETDAAVVLIHHERKSGGVAGHAIRGGSSLFGLVDQSLSLEKRLGGGGTENQRVLKALGRYDESPSELILELDGDKYRAIGTPEQFTLAARQAVVLGLLTDVPQTVESLAPQAKLTEAMTRKVLASLGTQVARQGEGVKSDPYRYCRPSPLSTGGDDPPEPGHSFLSDPLSVGTDTNPPSEATEAEELAA